jgi:haloalkane dehalogenase
MQLITNKMGDIIKHCMLVVVCSVIIISTSSYYKFNFIANESSKNITDSSITSYKKNYISIDGLQMAYHQEGKGSPILFFHGNPTSSYEWRKIIPHISGLGKCIAHDMMGMGNSSKVPATVANRYTYEYHYAVIEKFIDKIVEKKKKIILVAHDWGGVLAIHWARLHPGRVKGIAFMETFLEPLETGKSPAFAIDWFRNWRTAEMEKAILDSNRFVEKVLFGDAGKYLTDADKEEYRKPFKNIGEDRLATLMWPRQVSIDKDPINNHTVLIDNMQFMATTELPKLFVNAEPGALLAAEPRRAVIRKWPNLKEVKVKGGHFIQESSPDEIGNFLSEWIKQLK